MIQRLQSLFYLLAALCMGGIFFLPFASSNAISEPFLGDKIYEVKDHIAMIIFGGLAILLPLGAIFLFKNRSVQLRIGILSIVVSVLLIAVSYLLFMNGSKGMAESTTINDEAGMYLPFASLILLGIANYFVKKDDKLVKSMDRLR